MLGQSNLMFRMIYVNVGSVLMADFKYSCDCFHDLIFVWGHYSVSDCVLMALIEVDVQYISARHT